MKVRYFGCAFVGIVSEVATVLAKFETAAAEVATGPWTLGRVRDNFKWRQLVALEIY